MTQEEKDLLFKDLCGRLPYEVKCKIINVEYNDKVGFIDQLYPYHIDDFIKDTLNIKPYLFPMSSMTDEENNKLGDELIELELKALSDEIDSSVSSAYEIDYYNSHHIDYRGLIEKGLALDATNLNIY